MTGERPEKHGDLRFRGGVALPIGILAGIAFLVQFLGEPPLETHRPITTLQSNEISTVSPMRSVPGRLGEDPIKVALEAERARKVAEGQRRGPKSNNRLKKYFQKTIEGVLSTEEDSQFLLMPVLVTGSPYAEGVEQRMRTRYAVESALGRANYAMGYSDRVSYVSIRVKVKLRRGGSPTSIDRSIVVPVKLYRSSDIRNAHRQADQPGLKYTGVIVCWVAEDWLGDFPMHALEQIADALYGGFFDAKSESDRKVQPAQLDLKILGPASSDTLFKILKNEGPWSKNSERAKNDPNLFPRIDATMQIMRSTVNPKHIGGPHPLDEIHSIRDVRLIRTIGNDDHLGQAIWGELKLRGIEPSHKRHIVLITERDTVYGRALPASLRQYKIKLGDFSENIHEFKYYRGIDGRGIQGGDDRERIGKNGTDDELQQIDRPEGRSQYDYLRRMRKQMGVTSQPRILTCYF